MKKILAAFVAGVFMVSCLGGCAPLIIGAAVGGAGMYAASKDTIQGETDKPYFAIWESALKVTRNLGVIKKLDANAGYIEFETIEKSRVWVKLIKITQATTRLRVSARKFRLPNLSLAQEVYLKVINEAQQ